MRFDDIVDKYIQKNSDVLDIPKNSLCPDLFSFQEGTPPVLLESVRLQLLNGVERIAPYIKVRKYFLTGECIAPTSSPDKHSDVYIFIEYTSYSEDLTSQHRAFEQTKKLNGQYIDRTQHRVYYRLYKDMIGINNVNGAYDILANKWIKVPTIDDEDFDTDN